MSLTASWYWTVQNFEFVFFFFFLCRWCRTFWCRLINKWQHAGYWSNGCPHTCNWVSRVITSQREALQALRLKHIIAVFTCPMFRGVRIWNFCGGLVGLNCCLVVCTVSKVVATQRERFKCWCQIAIVPVVSSIMVHKRCARSKLVPAAKVRISRAASKTVHLFRASDSC